MVHAWSAATDVEWTCVIPRTYFVPYPKPLASPYANFLLESSDCKNLVTFVAPVFFCQMDPEELTEMYNSGIGQRKQKEK